MVSCTDPIYAARKERAARVASENAGGVLTDAEVPFRGSVESSSSPLVFFSAARAT